VLVRADSAWTGWFSVTSCLQPNCCWMWHHHN